MNTRSKTQTKQSKPQREKETAQCRVIPSLICMTKDKHEGALKILQVRSNPSAAQLETVYRHNVEVLVRLVEECRKKKIEALRVSSDLFPLSAHPQWASEAQSIIRDVLQEKMKPGLWDGLHVSAHPDLYVSLTSADAGVRERSRWELEAHAQWSEFIPWCLINIHIGSIKEGWDVHVQRLKKELEQCSEALRMRLSLENDETSYNVEDTVRACEELGVRMVLDWHHERCFVRHKQRQHSKGLASERQATQGEGSSPEALEALRESLTRIDEQTQRYVERMVKTYEGALSVPLFHISSPSGGWCGQFKDECKHAPVIDPFDNPVKRLKRLSSYGVKECVLDIEAKDKEEAIDHWRQHSCL